MAALRRDLATIEIARSADADVEVDSRDEAHAKVDQRFEAGEMHGWEEAIPTITREALPEEDAERRGCGRAHQR
jgi:hypothetical protein